MRISYTEKSLSHQGKSSKNGKSFLSEGPDASSHNWIFEIENIKEIIFKMPLNTSSGMEMFKERVSNIKIGKEICQELSLDLINIPQIFILEDHFYAEKKYTFIKTEEDLYSIYSNEKLLNIFKQLTIFICKSGATDLTYQNYKFLADGSGVCLYDIEDMNPDFPQMGLRTFVTGLSNNPGTEVIKLTEIKEIVQFYAPHAFVKLFPS